MTKISDNTTKRLLDSLKKEGEKLQDSLIEKIKSGGNKKEFTADEIESYELTDDDQIIFKAFQDYTEGSSAPGFNFKDFLGTPQAKILIPQVLIGKMRRAAEPEYFTSKLYKTIPVKSSQYMIFPSIGAIRAHDVAEGQEYPEEGLGIQEHDNGATAIQKVGLRISYSEELLQDAEWGIVNLLTEEAGKAMVRHREEKIFKEWKKHGHPVFDNALRTTNPEAGTTGLDFNSQPNDTLSTDDLLDLILALMNNRHTPTDLFMHPLVWPTMARNGLTGAFGKTPESANSSFQLGPQSMQGRLPFAFNVNLSPFAPIDKENKTFDLFCIDRNNIGAILQREKMTVDSFTDPSVDIHNTKFRERYGIVTFDEGRGITTAKNISLARSFPIADRVIHVDKPTHL